ncbi:hypothetical protein [Nostoc parmelioides]|nr:hypothetical protein [Nostoc parmelioides]
MQNGSRKGAIACISIVDAIVSFCLLGCYLMSEHVNITENKNQSA